MITRSHIHKRYLYGRCQERSKNCTGFFLGLITLCMLSDASLILLELSVCGFFLWGLSNNEHNDWLPFSPSRDESLSEVFEMLDRCYIFTRAQADSGISLLSGARVRCLMFCLGLSLYPKFCASKKWSAPARLCMLHRLIWVFTDEACIGVLGIQDICHFTSRDIGYYPYYFQGYGILCSIFWLLSGILKFQKTELWGYFPVYKGYLPVYFQGYGIFRTPYKASLITAMCDKYQNLVCK